MIFSNTELRDQEPKWTKKDYTMDRDINDDQKSCYLEKTKVLLEWELVGRRFGVLLFILHY